LGRQSVRAPRLERKPALPPLYHALVIAHVRGIYTNDDGAQGFHIGRAVSVRFRNERSAYVAVRGGRVVINVQFLRDYHRVI
jgi:hypothetical protein